MEYNKGKVCPLCNKDKVFCKSWICRKCSNKKSSVRYHKNSERFIEYQKDYNRKTNYFYDKNNENRKIKQKIRYTLRNLFKSGQIKKEKCLNCESTNNLQFHHYNYENPFNFIVLCKKCHLNEHKQIGYKIPLKGGKK